jgi:hypothetical protein
MDEPGDQANIDQDYFGILSAQGRLPMLESFTAQRMSRRERLEMGRRLRQTVPLSAHAVYAPAQDRADPVAVLARQNAIRVKKLVPVRCARMLASPFGFLRRAPAGLRHQ